jgi:hypothetical protein
MSPTLQPRLQGSFKHGNHRRFHSRILQVCEFDFLRLTALDHEAMCVSGTPQGHEIRCVNDKVCRTLFLDAQNSTDKAQKVYLGG